MNKKIIFFIIILSVFLIGCAETNTTNDNQISEFVDNTKNDCYSIKVPAFHLLTEKEDNPRIWILFDSDDWGNGFKPFNSSNNKGKKYFYFPCRTGKFTGENINHIYCNTQNSRVTLRKKEINSAGTILPAYYLYFGTVWDVSNSKLINYVPIEDKFYEIYDLNEFIQPKLVKATCRSSTPEDNALIELIIELDKF